MPAESSDSPPETPVRMETRAVEEGVMIRLLTVKRGHVWTRAELELDLEGSALDVSDALADLQSCGLIHINGELVTLSHAAQRMDDLDL